ncbi:MULTISPECIES: DUF2621 domain-containing protein [unclassified Paenibacillus]|uniref:DUF2621 domain-containing protein n=1 Tax=unclassified Paenibacillus TaxID=185978 RepID=UPI001C0FB644|nr:MULTISPECIES: DUF2621 domain-containing protein [unclassified Paenibacillus]MBU5440731.1 DUF2621 domain-containing protein [Paenibacillus sp. MSJ-34]CAH0120413.1 hypothetical protein PAE9249_02932 [Paenibacillus sp. CECT 9249]
MHTVFASLFLSTSGPSNGFMNMIVLWSFVLIGLMAIGGFFMFRKFFKVLPKQDGKSKLDWQNYWVETSRHLWTDESKQFLDQLVQPVPSPFRDIAKHSIAAKIGQLAVESGAKEVTRDLCVKGYIMATPKRDYRNLVKFLEKNGIDYTPYRHLFNK